MIKIFKYYFFALFLFSSLLHAAAGNQYLETLEKNKFKDLFNESLYDLNDGYASTLDEKYALLQERKKQILESKLIFELESYKALLKSPNWRKWTAKILKASATGTASGVSLAKLGQMMAKKAAEKALEVGTKELIKGGALGGLGGAALAAADIAIDQIYDPSQASELDRVNMMIKRFLIDIKEPHLEAIEKKYIAAKYHKTCPLPLDRQKSIEAMLIEARDTNALAKLKSISCIEDVLALPMESILVPYLGKASVKKNEDAALFRVKREAFLDEIFPSLKDGIEPEFDLDEAPKLDSARYNIDARKGLKKVLRAICNASWMSATGETRPLITRGFLFFGRPSVGKTKAAELLADKAGISFAQIKFREPKDLAGYSIYGAERAQDTVESDLKGSIFKALLTKNKEGRRSKNLIILLDDVDRAMQTIGGLVDFLMELLDPEKFIKECNFYKIDMDLRHVIIIATVNKDLRNDPACDGLRVRWRFIDFKNIPDEAVKKVVMASIKTDRLTYSVYYYDQPDIRESIADFLLGYEERDLRRLADNADVLLDENEGDWEDVAQSSGWVKIE